MAPEGEDDGQDKELSHLLVGSGATIHNSSKPEAPDWSLWGSMVDANLQDTAILSCDIAPEWFRHGMKDGPRLQEYFRRWTVMRNHIEAGTMPGVVIRPQGLRSERRITLRTFPAWAAEQGWPQLPEDFPGVRAFIAAAEAAKPILIRQSFPP